MNARRTRAKTRTRLRLELGAPATPALVIQVARMFQEALDAAGEPLTDDSVTLVVGNFKAGFIEPVQSMTLADYQSTLGATQADWKEFK